jgi:ABC-2 type transport system permease protein
VTTPGWWTGTRLVAGRAFVEGVRSRTWRAVTILLLALGVAVVVVPRVVDAGPTTWTLATVGDPSPALIDGLAAAAEPLDAEVTVLTVRNEDVAEQTVRSGAADVALASVDGQLTLFVRSDRLSPFPGLVSQAVVAQQTAAGLAAAGLDPAVVADVLAVAPPPQVGVGPAADERRAAVGFAVGIVLFLAITTTVSSGAAAVATEKSTRIAEVLLTVLRPTQLLVGTVAGVGALGLVQLAALALPAGIGLATSTAFGLPAGAVGDVALGVAWFLVGIVLYAFVYAGLAALVEKPSEVTAATLPVNVVLIGSYLVAVTVTTTDPESWGSIVASMVPVSAPLVMPARWAAGGVPVWQLVLSMLLTALTAAVLAVAASRVYAGGITASGSRRRLRDVLRER